MELEAQVAACASVVDAIIEVAIRPAAVSNAHDGEQRDSHRPSATRRRAVRVAPSESSSGAKAARATAEPPDAAAACLEATTKPPEASTNKMTHFLNSRFAFFYLRRDRARRRRTRKATRTPSRRLGSFDSRRGLLRHLRPPREAPFINQ